MNQINDRRKSTVRTVAASAVLGFAALFAADAIATTNIVAISKQHDPDVQLRLINRNFSQLDAVVATDRASLTGVVGKVDAGITTNRMYLRATGTTGTLTIVNGIITGV